MKSTLTLLEQSIMLLVFACVSALCLGGFLWAEEVSQSSQDRDRAVILAQNAAETLKAQGRAGGDMGHTLTQSAAILGGEVSQGLWVMSYDKAWNPLPTGNSEEAFRLCAQGVPAPKGLWQAEITVMKWAEQEDIPLFSLTAAWQEVRP